MTKINVWLQKSQEWYFIHALPYAKQNNIKLSFGQPPVTYNSCKKWYKVAKKWHNSLVFSKTLGGEIPPPPPSPELP